MDASAKTKWDNHYVKESDHLHVTPMSDHELHLISVECPCFPSLELIARPDDSVGAVYLHRVVSHGAS